MDRGLGGRSERIASQLGREIDVAARVGLHYGKVRESGGDLFGDEGIYSFGVDRMLESGDWLARERGLRFADYNALWRWSVEDLEGFWGAIWAFFDVQASELLGEVFG